jgi:hypothetical protein
MDKKWLRKGNCTAQHDLTAGKSGLDGCIQVYIGCSNPIQTWARTTK